MNRLNKHSKNLSVDFIPWHQSSPNGLYYRNGFKLDTGLPPTVTQFAQNKSSSSTTSPSVEALSEKLNVFLTNETFLAELAQNTFKAHKDWIGNCLIYPALDHITFSHNSQSMVWMDLVVILGLNSPIW